MLHTDFSQTQPDVELDSALTADSLTHSRLVSFIDVTLACEDAYSKLAKVVTVADVYDEECANDSLVHICELRFGYKVNLLFRL